MPVAAGACTRITPPFTSDRPIVASLLASRCSPKDAFVKQLLQQLDRTSEDLEVEKLLLREGVASSDEAAAFLAGRSDYAVALLDEIRSTRREAYAKPVRALLVHKSAQVQLHAIQALAALGVHGEPLPARRQSESDNQVQAAAYRWWMSTEPRAAIAELFNRSDDLTLSSNWINLMVDAPLKASEMNRMRDQLRHGQAEARLRAASVLAANGSIEEVGALLNDSDASIRPAAAMYVVANRNFEDIAERTLRQRQWPSGVADQFREDQEWLRYATEELSAVPPERRAERLIILKYALDSSASFAGYRGSFMVSPGRMLWLSCVKSAC